MLDLLRSRTSLQLEVLALRQQLAMVANRDNRRHRFRTSERIFWVWLYRLWPDSLRTLAIFKPDILVRWHRKGFRLYWTWKSRRYQGGRPAIDPDVRELIRTMPRNNITAPRYVMRDRDSIYGKQFRTRVKSLGIEEVVSAPRSPWQNPYVERIIGSIRRECLNHVIIFNERHLRQVLKSYATYYHEARTHLSLAKQSPVPRSIEPPEQGNIFTIPHVDGLHHEYRRAALFLIWQH